MRRRLAPICVLLAALSAPAAAFGDGASTAAAPVSGSYTGTTEGASIGVAVIAEPPAAEGQPRTISMYVCNGTSLAAWLTGQTTGDSAVLRSADRRFNARVKVGTRNASGVLALPTGRQLAFDAATTSSVAGLFDVTVAANGAFTGTSPTGAHVTGRIGVAGKLPAETTVRANATAGGRSVTLTAPARNLTPGTYRWIVLPNLKVVGSNKRDPRFGTIGGLGRLVTRGGVVAAKLSAFGVGIKGWDDRRCAALATEVTKLGAKAEAAILKNSSDADSLGAKATAKFDLLESKCGTLVT